MALAWSPELYGRHAAPRLRPAIELLARVPLVKAQTVVDLGCGAGALFAALRHRFPQARLIGVDASDSMLAQAAGIDPRAELVAADAATWRPSEPVDLIIANAALHWVPDHARLLPALLGYCHVLAVQVPDNFAAPAYRAILAQMAESPWAERLASVRMGDNVLPPETYAAILGGAGAAADIWQTVYYQLLAGPDAVLEWVRATTLLPIQAALGGADSDDTTAFERELGARLRTAYPVDADGTVLFPFRRLFFVATAGQRMSSG
jgi:trans-aconitate 2-methyltransferase